MFNVFFFFSSIEMPITGEKSVEQNFELFQLVLKICDHLNENWSSYEISK